MSPSTGTDTRLPSSAQSAPTVGPLRRSTRWREAGVVVAIALAAGLAHLPFLADPLGSDEGGFLMVASQWASGTSLYGNYWVDRPPLLIAYFALADQLGGAMALRLLGIVTVLIAVLAAGWIGHLLSPRQGRAPRAQMLTTSGAAALTAAIFLASPLFGTGEVNGELISSAAILGAMAVGLAATRRRASSHQRASSRLWWLAMAGSLAATAVLVKQNQIDAFIFLVGLVIVTGLRAGRGDRRRQVRRDLGAVGLGAGMIVLLVVAGAALRGTAPLALWDAMVTFRLDASAVIQSSASPATGARAWSLLGVFALSGAPLLVLHLLGRLRPRPSGSSSAGHDLRWVTVAVLAWEGVSVVGGGSYWHHYLICLVPGLVLSVAVSVGPVGSATRARDRVGWPVPLRMLRSPVASLAYCGVVAAISLTTTIAGTPQGTTVDPTSAWLAARAAPSDTALVAYGQPSILQEAGIDSPYPYLWSLIVRVKDPDLALLASTMAGADRPDWVVTGSGGLHGWGIDATSGDQQLTERYRQVAVVDDHTIYLQRSHPLP